MDHDILYDVCSEKLKEETMQDEAGGNADAKVAAVGNPVSPFMHPVCGPASAFGRSTLHRAVCDMNVLAIQSCGTGDLAKRDDAGFCPLHTAAALSMLTPSNTILAFDICKLLIDAGADASYTDSNGNTPLHWAARAGNERAAHLMLLNKCQTGMPLLNFSSSVVLCYANTTGTFSSQMYRTMPEKHLFIGQCERDSEGYPLSSFLLTTEHLHP